MMRAMGRFDDKCAIITGAASGIGRATALRLASEGAAVVVADIDHAVGQTAEAVKEAGGRARGAVMDVSDGEAIEELVAGAVEAFGTLDVVFANAGIVSSMAPVLDLTADDWRKILDVNLMGVFWCIKYGGRHMVANGGGSIVCTASVAGLRAGAGPAHYSATKAAVINLVQTTAAQLGGTGVRINAVCPGLIETGMTAPMFDAARTRGTEDKIGQLNPLRRAGQPEEIASAVAFLASHEASYVNGQAIVVDGGLSASHPHVPGKQW